MTRYSQCVAICLLFCVCSTARSQDRVSSLDAGAVKDSTYSNAYFGMKLRIPDGWQVQDNEATKALFERGKDLVVGDDKNLSAIISASEKQSLTLLTMFKYQPGSPVESNPGFVCIVERVSHLPGIKKGTDYLFHVKKGLSAAKVEVTFDKDIYDEAVNGRPSGSLRQSFGLGTSPLSKNTTARFERATH
jgi:hypothetical protein